MYIEYEWTEWDWEENIDTDPLFVGGGSYKLTESSPCIDLGNPDMDYNDGCFPPSLGGELNDMGAYGGPGSCGWCDRDGDGSTSEICGGADCSDANQEIYGGAPELCDGFDNDCDGAPAPEETDGDEDGFMICEGDCDDAIPAVYPGADEICDNGIDDDCDGDINEGCPPCWIGTINRCNY